jgi:hypothetical protein
MVFSIQDATSDAEASPACPHSPSVSPLFFTSVVKPLIRSCAACSCSTTLWVKLVFVSALNWAIASFMNLPESAKDAMDWADIAAASAHRPAAPSAPEASASLVALIEMPTAPMPLAMRTTEFHVAWSTSTSAPNATAPMAAQSVSGIPMSIRNLSPLLSPSSRIWRSAAVTAETAGTNCPPSSSRASRKERRIALMFFSTLSASAACSLVTFTWRVAASARSLRTGIPCAPLFAKSAWEAAVLV